MGKLTCESCGGNSFRTIDEYRYICEYCKTVYDWREVDDNYEESLNTYRENETLPYETVEADDVNEAVLTDTLKTKENHVAEEKTSKHGCGCFSAVAVVIVGIIFFLGLIAAGLFVSGFIEGFTGSNDDNTEVVTEPSHSASKKDLTQIPEEDYDSKLDTAPENYPAVDYSMLATAPESVEGKQITISGDVLQADDPGKDEFADVYVHVDGDKNKVALIVVESSYFKANRVSEGEDIVAHCIGYGVYSYDSEGNGRMTVPVAVSRFYEKKPAQSEEENTGV